MRRSAAAEGALDVDPSGVVSFWARERPELVAIRYGDATETYFDLDRRVSTMAREFVDQGAGPGHRIAIVSENEPEAVAAILAAWRTGAWAVPLNARYTTRELSAILTHAQPRLVVVTPSAASRHAQLVAMKAPIGRSRGLLAAVHVDAPREAVDPVASERTVLMLYTSGTTGAPKGVMLPARALAFMAALWAQRPVSAGDRIYQALPISHSYGLCSYLFGALNLGCEIELARRFAPSDLHRAFADGLVLLQGVPTMYAHYLQFLEHSGASHVAPALRAISTGGAPLDPDLKTRVEAVFGLELRQAFGLTEAGPTVTVPDDRPQGASALGRPAPGVEVRIVDSKTGEDAKGPGEMWVRTPGAMKGYYRDEAATGAVLTRDGWLHTGDLVRRAPDGVLHIVGRSKT